MCAAALMKKDLALPIGMDNSGWENLLVLLWITCFCINPCYKLCVTAGSKLILCNILSKSFICYFNLFFNLRQWIGGGSWDSWGSLTSGLPSLKLYSFGLIVVLWNLFSTLPSLILISFDLTQVCKSHSGILGKGLALSHSPTILEALEGNLPLHLQTNEHSFLEDFITCVQNSSGGRLAR